MEEASEGSTARERGGMGLPLAHPAGPMTYTELTRSGVGRTMPDVLWVPYFSDLSQDQLPAPNSTVESRNSEEGMEGSRREPSRSVDSIGRGRNFRNQLTPQASTGKTKEKPWATRKGGQSNLGSPSSYLLQPSSKWDALPEPIMHIIFSQVDLRGQQNCRLVSKYWRHLINNNLKAVQPSKPRIHVLQEKFTRLVSVDFSRCEQLRNRNLHVFATSKLRIEELVIGHLVMGMYSKPRITNAGIGYIACMRSLKRLTFVDCNAFTNAGIEKLAPLTNLQELSFIRCTRISEKGMDFLQKLLKLRSLTIFMCTKVTDVLLGMLRTMKALKHLHLGHVRLTRERLEDLWTDGKSKLEELTVHGVEITAGSLLALGEYSSLKALGMTACYQVDVYLTMSTLHRLSNLERVNLLSIEETTNQHLIDISTHLPNLQHLKMVLSPQVTGVGIEALAGLSNLQACCFESSQASLQALHAVSCLRGLTCAEFPGTTIPAELLNALPYLTKLQRLSLRSQPREMVVLSAQPLWIGSIEPILRCMRLKFLDMSYTDMSITLVNALLSKLVSRDRARKLYRPVLEDLCMHGCVIADQGIELMNTCFPSVLCHRKQPSTLESSTWVSSIN